MFLIDAIRKSYIRFEKKFLKYFFSPNLKISFHEHSLIRLGSEYGGWTFLDLPELYGATILSCGVGEDISFDVEFASKYKAKVVFIDPTPRSIMHYEYLQARLGMSATLPYTKTGRQPVESYELSTLTNNNFLFYKKALWNKKTSIKFFSPPNEEHVSHSIINYQNQYRTDTKYIEVDAVQIDDALDDLKIKKLTLIKLDIEGAEIEVLQDMLSKDICPLQILVEYDELAFPSRRSKLRIEKTHFALLRKGYKLINFDKPNNFLYVNFQKFTTL